MLVRPLVLELLARVLSALMPSQPTLPPVEPEPNADALKAAGEILKISTGLATGTLVFSVGLLSAAMTSEPLVRATLAATWVALFLSIIGGILAQSVIPVLLDERRFDLEAPTFTWPGRIHQILFGVGILGLSTVLLATLYSDPGALRIGSAGHAVLYARSSLRPDEKADRVELVQLVKGADPNRASLLTWQVRFRLTPLRDGVPVMVDVLIDAKRGTAIRIPQ